MSLILEALKKSEAERRLGRAPDLHTVMTRPPRPRRLPWALSGVAAVVLAATVSWWWFTPGAPRADAVLEANQDTTHVAPAVVATEPVAETLPTSPTRAAPAAAGAAATIANAPLPQDPDFAGTERESIAVAATAIPLADAASNTATRSARPTPQVAHPPALQDAPASPQFDHRPVVKAAPADVQPELEPLPRLAHLLPSEREGLPPLHLSMHVYDPEPGARFVLIDGKRYRQGDSVAQGVVVDAIRSDGAVLSYRGRRFLLPRP